MASCCRAAAPRSDWMRRRLTEPVGFHVHHLEHVARLRHRLEDKGPVDEEAQPADALLWPRVSHPRRAVVHDLAIGPRLERAHGEARVVGKREGLAACIVVEEREGVGIEARAAGERAKGLMVHATNVRLPRRLRRRAGGRQERQAGQHVPLAGGEAAVLPSHWKAQRERDGGTVVQMHGDCTPRRRVLWGERGAAKRQQVAVVPRKIVADVKARAPVRPLPGRHADDLAPARVQRVLHHGRLLHRANIALTLIHPQLRIGGAEIALVLRWDVRRPEPGQAHHRRQWRGRRRRRCRLLRVRQGRLRRRRRRWRRRRRR